MGFEHLARSRPNQRLQAPTLDDRDVRYANSFLCSVFVPDSDDFLVEPASSYGQSHMSRQ